MGIWGGSKEQIIFEIHKYDDEIHKILTFKNYSFHLNKDSPCIFKHKNSNVVGVLEFL